MNSQPGWYPDPQNPTIVRFWDGQQWTSATQPNTLAGPAQFRPGAPPKKPMSTGAKLLIIGVSILGIGISISALSSNDKSTSTASRIASTTRAPAAVLDKVAPETKPPTTTDQEQVATGFGTEARDGKFGFVVTKVESGLATVGRESSWFSETAEGQFVVVYVDVTNTSNKSQYYASSNQVLIDDQGREFTNNSSAEFGLEGEDKGAGDINPGITRSTRVVFDIPLGAVPAAIEVHDSMFSDGARINFN
ncbi:DUF4352 domain-containing protein [Listeria monocytogenes]|nr:DUF4352 domain-containing protein [Listeria monocytogenes]